MSKPNPKPRASPSIAARLLGATEANPLDDPRPISPVAKAEADLARLRGDHADIVAEQLKLERARRDVPASVFKTRAILEAAIPQAEARVLQANAKAAQEAYEIDADVWANLQRQRCETILALRQINKALEAKRRSYKRGGIYPDLPLDNWSFNLFGTGRGAPGASGLRAQEFLRQAVSAGIISPRDMKDDD